MTAPSDPAGSKGMRMIASYRAERLSQRPLLRTSLRRPPAGPRAEKPPTAPVAAATGAEIASVTDPAVLAASVFGGLFSQEEARQQAAAVAAEAECVPDPAPDSAPEPVAELVAEAGAESDVGSAPGPDVAVSAAAEVGGTADAGLAPPEFDPPLAEIGFGPGMLIRLSQIGLHTTGDMAQVSPAHLRAALGDISRLVDVEAWISHARARMRQPATPPG